MNNHGNELYKLEKIKEKVFNNVKLTREEEWLLETIELDEETQTPGKNYTKNIFNTPSYREIFDHPHESFRPSELIWGTIHDQPYYTGTMEFEVNVSTIPVEEKMENIEYCGVYILFANQNVFFEDTFTDQQIIKKHWLSEAEDAIQIERSLSDFSDGWIEGTKHGTDEYTQTTLFYFPIGVGNSVCVDMDKYKQ